jgi:RimJ/RimL family protein N-acetyltransferase
MLSAIGRWRHDPDALLSSRGHWAAATHAGDVVGGLSLQPAGPDDDDLTISCALAPVAWGRGYATEASAALLRWALHEAGATEVYALVRCDNTRALATAQRVGMDWIDDRVSDAVGRQRVFRLRHGDLGLAD